MLVEAIDDCNHPIQLNKTFDLLQIISYIACGTGKSRPKEDKMSAHSASTHTHRHTPASTKFNQHCSATSCRRCPEADSESDAWKSPTMGPHAVPHGEREPCRRLDPRSGVVQVAGIQVIFTTCNKCNLNHQDSEANRDSEL